jgi:hypothetical protein
VAARLTESHFARVSSLLQVDQTGAGAFLNLARLPSATGNVIQSVVEQKRNAIAAALAADAILQGLNPAQQRAVAYGIGENNGAAPPLLIAAGAGIAVGVDQIDIRLCLGRLGASLDVAATPLPSVTDDEIQILSIPVRLRRSGSEIRMLIDGTDPVVAARPDARLIKLLLKARRFSATLVGSDGVPFATLAEREGVSRSYFTRVVRLSYLAPDIAQAILDGRQPRDLTADKLLAHSRLPLAWHDQRTAFGFA